MTSRPLNSTVFTLTSPGYEKLAEVLSRAFAQAAVGKGKERHARGEPFHEQVICIGARKFGVGSLLFQAFKKSEESQRLDRDAGVRELLGAINYLAAAVIVLEEKAPQEAVGVMKEVAPPAHGRLDWPPISGLNPSAIIADEYHQMLRKKVDEQPIASIEPNSTVSHPVGTIANGFVTGVRRVE